MTNEGNIYSNMVFVDVIWFCWNLTTVKPHNCKKATNYNLGLWLWLIQIHDWFKNAQSLNRFRSDNIKTWIWFALQNHTHTTPSQKKHIPFWHSHVNIQRVPNQTRKLLQTPHAAYFKCSWTATLWVQTSNIYIIISSIFPALKAQSALQKSGTRDLLSSCVSR